MELYSFALLTLITLIFLALSTWFKTNWATGFRMIAAGLLVIMSIIGLYGIEYENGATTAYTLEQKNLSTYTLNTSDNTTYYVSSNATNWFINASTRAKTFTGISNAWTQYFFITTLLGGFLFALHSAWRGLVLRKNDD